MSLMAIFHKFNCDSRVNDYANSREYLLLKSDLDDITVQYASDILDISQKQIISNEKRTIFGYMLGEIYDLNKNDLILKGHIFNTHTDIEYVIHLSEEYGEEALEKLNGKFVICLLDKEKEEMLIINDRYGFYTFYYYKEEKSFCFCNVPKIISDSLQNKSINTESVQDFFSFGYLLGNKTLINEINKVPPASIIKVKDSKFKLRSYWNWNCIEKAKDVRYEEAVEKLGILWIEAVRKIITKHKKVYMTLSGGLDSRATLAAIDYLGMNCKVDSAFTFGIKDCLDYVLASRVAKIAKIKHIFIELDSEIWWKNIQLAIENGMGEISIIHTHGLCLRSIPLKYVFLNGFAGDLVLGGSFLKHELTNVSEEYFSSYLRERMRSRGLKNELLIKELPKGQIQDNVSWKSTDYFFIDNILRNCNTLGDDYYGAYPFFDNDLIEYIYSLPQEWRVNSNIYKAMLLKYFPKFFNNIPWQKTGLPISGEDKLTYQKNDDNKKLKVVLFGASKLGRQALNIYQDKWNILYFCDNDKSKWGKKTCDIEIISPNELLSLNNLKVIITSMYEDEIERQLIELGIKNYKRYSEIRSFVNYKEWIKEPVISKYISEILLSNEIKNESYYNINEIKRTISNHMSNKENNVKDICLLFTFEIFRKTFLNENLK